MWMLPDRATVCWVVPWADAGEARARPAAGTVSRTRAALVNRCIERSLSGEGLDAPHGRKGRSRRDVRPVSGDARTDRTVTKGLSAGSVGSADGGPVVARPYRRR